MNKKKYTESQITDVIAIEKGVGDGGNKWRGIKIISKNVWYLDQNDDYLSVHMHHN